MTDDMTRIEALRLLLAKHEPDGLTRALVWSYKQADRKRLTIKGRTFAKLAQPKGRAAA